MPVPYSFDGTVPCQGELMKAHLYIGPLIEHSGKFSYDVFSLTDGFRSSFSYPQIEEARYDRRR